VNGDFYQVAKFCIAKLLEAVDEKEKGKEGIE
jgi:hypothetical protein